MAANAPATPGRRCGGLLCSLEDGRSVLARFEGQGILLRQVTWRNRQTGEESTHHIGNVFVMIGAEPNTEWLQGCLELDTKGFIKTGYAADGLPLASPYETSRPGIYAVGDVRSGSVKRVASSVVQAIHHFLNPVVA
jgi:thioredoxin reductase (NADPH)